jgi:hypothetical protein
VPFTVGKIPVALTRCQPERAYPSLDIAMRVSYASRNNQGESRGDGSSFSTNPAATERLVGAGRM